MKVTLQRNKISLYICTYRVAACSNMSAFPYVVFRYGTYIALNDNSSSSNKQQLGTTFIKCFQLEVQNVTNISK